MRSVNWAGSKLVGYFAEFYQEVAQIKEAINFGRLAILLELDTEHAYTGRDLASLVSGRLSQKLQRQLLDIKADATAAEQRVYDVAHYVMAVLADEIFILETDWAGQEHWVHYLLEYTLFKRRQAGSQFFELINQLLRLRHNASHEVDLAAIFLLALQLGFKGEFRGHDGQHALADYRKKLMRFINERRQPQDIDQAIFPMAYHYNLSQTTDQRLAPLKPWILTSLAVLIVYLIISSAIWFQLIGPVTDLLNTFLKNGGSMI